MAQGNGTTEAAQWSRSALLRALAALCEEPDPRTAAVGRLACALIPASACVVVPPLAPPVQPCAAPRAASVVDARADPAWSEHPQVAGGVGPRAFACIPLAPGDPASAALCLFDDGPRAFDLASPLLRDLVEVATTQLSSRRARSDAQEAATSASTHSAILAQLAEGVIVTDTEGHITLVNDAAAALHGVRELGTSPDGYSAAYSLFTEDGAPYRSRDLPLARAVRGGTVREERWRIRRQDGVEVLAIGTAKPLRSADGRAIGAVLTMRDDTERHAAHLSLRESETRLRVLTDSLPSGAVFQIAARGDGAGRHFRYVSEGYERLTGVPAAAVLADPSLHDALLLDDDRGVLEEARRRSVAGLAPFDLEVRFRRWHDGRLRWARIVSAPRRAEEGWLVWDGLLVEITGQKEAEAALVAANATLNDRVAERTREAEAARAAAERASAAKSEFLATMSHEIRTPLHGVLGYADLLLEGPGLAGDARLHAERVRACGAALLAIVDDVLDFAAIEAGSVALRAEAFSPDALLDEVVAIARGVALRKGVDLRRVGGAVAGEWVGDAARLRQVLLNLVNNAVKFTEIGWVEVSLAAVDASGALRFRVRDTGIGIPDEARPRLFERFAQVDGSIARRFGGTGLGLAIARRLVEAMAGRIGFESRVGDGSTFWFEVPLPRATRREPASARPAPPAGRAAQVLLVEDVEVNRQLARLVLESAGHLVDVAADGREAVERVAAGAYDVVLMDVHMPVLDGIGATHAIRASGGAHAAVPILAMTANVLPEQVAAFRAAGMDGHVGKPFRQVELLEAVARAVARRDLAAPQAGERPDVAIPEEIERLVGKATLASLVASFRSDLAARVSKLGATPDYDAVAREAHALIPMAGTLGFHRLVAICRDIAATPGPAADRGLLAALRAEADRVEAALRGRRPDPVSG